MSKLNCFIVLTVFVSLAFAHPTYGVEETPDVEEAELLDSQNLDEILVWTCTARGRVDANIYAEFHGYSRSYYSAQKLALAKCRDIAQGCRITSCRPGL